MHKKWRSSAESVVSEIFERTDRQSDSQSDIKLIRIFCQPGLASTGEKEKNNAFHQGTRWVRLRLHRFDFLWICCGFLYDLLCTDLLYYGSFSHELHHNIDVMNVYNVYKKFFVNAFIILSTFMSIKIT